MSETVRERLQADGPSLAWRAALLAVWSLTVFLIGVYVASEQAIRTTSATRYEVVNVFHPPLQGGVLLAGLLAGLVFLTIVIDKSRAVQHE